MTTGSQLQSQLQRPIQTITLSQSDTTAQWQPLGQTSRNWRGMTTLGNDVYACVQNGDIYRQVGGQGNFLPLGQTSRSWFGMTTLGNDFYVSVYNGDIYRQVGGQGNFLPLGQTSRLWSGMTTLGNDVYVSVYNGDIYRQVGGQGNFLPLGQTSRSWYGMTTLGNDVYVSVYNGDIYRQVGGQGNFLPLGQTSRLWLGMTTLGNDFYVSVQNGDIYKLTITQSERIFSFPTHNLQTGDQVFLTSSPTRLEKKFVIRIDNNQFKFATTSQNATNGVGELTPTQFPPLQTRISTDLGRTMTDFGTTWFVNSPVWRRSSYDASARSMVGFSINTPVSIDWTYPATSLNSLNSLSNIVGLSTEDESTIFAILCPPRITNSQFLIASPSSTLVQSIAGVTGVTNISGHKGRITITSERRITFQIATLTGTTYTTVWTSGIQDTTLPLLYFYNTFCYSQERIIDCKITYL